MTIAKDETVFPHSWRGLCHKARLRTDPEYDPFAEEAVQAAKSLDPPRKVYTVRTDRTPYSRTLSIMLQTSYNSTTRTGPKLPGTVVHVVSLPGQTRYRKLTDEPDTAALAVSCICRAQRCEMGLLLRWSTAMPFVCAAPR